MPIACLLGEVVPDPLAVSLLEEILPPVCVFLPMGEHGVDQSGKLVGSGCDGLGFVHACAHPPVIRPQRRLARTQDRSPVIAATQAVRVKVVVA